MKHIDTDILRIDTSLKFGLEFFLILYLQSHLWWISLTLLLYPWDPGNKLWFKGGFFDQWKFGKNKNEPPETKITEQTHLLR